MYMIGGVITVAPDYGIQFQCSICKKSTSPVARCHWPINKATGDLKEEGTVAEYLLRVGMVEM